MGPWGSIRGGLRVVVLGKWVDLGPVLSLARHSHGGVLDVLALLGTFGLFWALLGCTLGPAGCTLGPAGCTLARPIPRTLKDS